MDDNSLDKLFKQGVQREYTPDPALKAHMFDKLSKGNRPFWIKWRFYFLVLALAIVTVVHSLSLNTNTSSRSEGRKERAVSNEVVEPTIGHGPGIFDISSKNGDSRGLKNEFVTNEQSPTNFPQSTDVAFDAQVSNQKSNTDNRKANMKNRNSNEFNKPSSIGSGINQTPQAKGIIPNHTGINKVIDGKINSVSSNFDDSDPTMGTEHGTGEGKSNDQDHLRNWAQYELFTLIAKSLPHPFSFKTGSKSVHPKFIANSIGKPRVDIPGIWRSPWSIQLSYLRSGRTSIENLEGNGLKHAINGQGRSGFEFGLNYHFNNFYFGGGLGTETSYGEVSIEQVIVNRTIEGVRSSFSILDEQYETPGGIVTLIKENSDTTFAYDSAKELRVNQFTTNSIYIPIRIGYQVEKLRWFFDIELGSTLSLLKTNNFGHAQAQQQSLLSNSITAAKNQNIYGSVGIAYRVTPSLAIGGAYRLNRAINANEPSKTELVNDRATVFLRYNFGR